MFFGQRFAFPRNFRAFSSSRFNPRFSKSRLKLSLVTTSGILLSSAIYSTSTTRILLDSQSTSSVCHANCPGSIAQKASESIQSVVAIRVELSVSIPRLFHTEHGILSSTGSGFFLSSDGLILTNAHVVNDALDGAVIKITTYDGNVYFGELKAIDPWSDLALVKLLNEEQRRWKAVSFARSNPRIGDWLFTFGHPLGLTHTLTTGIISALNHRNADIDMSGKLDTRLRYIQANFTGFDFGNSGGAVFNLQGDVVGINVIKGVTEGISFAVDIHSASEVIDQLKTSGKVIRPWIGLRLLTLAPPVVHQIVHERHSKFVNRELSHSQHRPTHSQTDEPIQSESDNRKNQDSPKRGKWVSKFQEWTQTILHPTETDITSNIHEHPHRNEDETILDIVKFGYVDRGLLITSVFPNSPSHQARCLPGDVITKVNGIEVESASHLFAIVGCGKKPVVLTVRRLHRHSTSSGGNQQDLQENEEDEKNKKKSKVKREQMTVKEVSLVMLPEELDVFDNIHTPLSSGDHEALYEAYKGSLNEEKREKLEFLE